MFNVQPKDVLPEPLPSPDPLLQVNRLVALRPILHTTSISFSILTGNFVAPGRILANISSPRPSGSTSALLSCSYPFSMINRVCIFPSEFYLLGKPCGHDEQSSRPNPCSFCSLLKNVPHAHSISS